MLFITYLQRTRAVRTQGLQVELGDDLVAAMLLDHLGFFFFRNC